MADEEKEPTAEEQPPQGEPAVEESPPETAPVTEGEGEASAEAEEAVAEPVPAPEEAEPAAEPQAAAEEPAPEPAPADAGEPVEHTFESFQAMTVALLRDVAQGIEHDALHGYSTMHKEDLIQALCTALGIEAHVHHEVVGIDKAAVKAKIKQLKQERDRAVEAGDGKQLKLVRRRIKRLKRKIHKATI